MPSFDLVSEIDRHEASNAIDQANREVANRFDFKGTDSKFAYEGSVVTLHTQSEFQLKQMLDMLQDKLTRRGVDIACLKIDPPEVTGREARQQITLKEGLETPLAKRIVQEIKQGKLKVQATIMGDRVRVAGKKKDDLQRVIAHIRSLDLDLPIQVINFRD